MNCFSPKDASERLRKIPDLDYIHKELRKSGVTLKLLWYEYCEGCRSSQEMPLMYSQFCFHYQKHAQKKRAIMYIPRKPGEQLEVDWAGTTMSVVDRDTGEVIPAYIFVAALSFSQCAFVQPFLRKSWIQAHINMYKFYGGATRILIPDNLKTGVQKSDWYTPEINKTYRELSEYYETTVIPARVRKPKDKPNAEGTVGVIKAWIIAALRNQKFFFKN